MTCGTQRVTVRGGQASVRRDGGVRRGWLGAVVGVAPREMRRHRILRCSGFHISRGSIVLPDLRGWKKVLVLRRAPRGGLVGPGRVLVHGCKGRLFLRKYLPSDARVRRMSIAAWDVGVWFLATLALIGARFDFSSAISPGRRPCSTPAVRAHSRWASGSSPASTAATTRWAASTRPTGSPPRWRWSRGAAHGLLAVLHRVPPGASPSPSRRPPSSSWPASAGSTAPTSTTAPPPVPWRRPPSSSTGPASSAPRWPS